MVSLGRRSYSANPYEQSRRSPARKILIGVNILLACVLLFGVAIFGYANWQLGNVARLALDGLRNDDNIAAMNVLMVGSDSRADLAAGEEEQYGTTSDAAGQRADTIMILHVDPDEEQARLLSIPRDTWVTNALTGRSSRINESFDQGPNGLVETIKNNFDIPIDHYAQVDFDGFKGVVDAIGGVEIPFASPARDKNSGLDVRTTGCVKLSGDQALAYARSRYYQTQQNGRWVSDPRSDLSRIDRQQDFIRRVIKTAVNSAKNPLTLNAVVSNGVKNVTLDEGFSTTDIIRVANRFRSLDASTVEMMTIPTAAATIGGASVLRVNEDESKTLVDRFLNGAPKDEPVGDIPPSSISMRVLNGSGTSGQAAEASASLQDLGFVVTGTGDGTRRNSTVIQYSSGNADKAATLARYIGGAVTTAEDSTVKGVDLVVVTGSTFTGIVDPTAPTTAPPVTEPPAASTTTTTASPFVPSGDC